jgi:hypothetical protein
MASLGLSKPDGKWEHNCGASLISRAFLITAALCKTNPRFN